MVGGWEERFRIRLIENKSHMVCQSVPMLPIDQCDDAAWCFGCAAVVFAIETFESA